MLCTQVHSAVSQALHTSIVVVETQVSRGFAGLVLIGNASESCREGKERARAALEALDIQIPATRLLISLTPGDIKKSGNHLDLPMAVSLSLVLKAEAPVVDTRRWLFAAELGLDGSLKPVRGVVSFAIEAASQGYLGVVVARDNLEELKIIESFGAQGIKELRLIAFDHLAEVLQWIFTGVLRAVTQTESLPKEPEPFDSLIDFDDMVLSEQLRKVAMVSATGLHSVLLRGTPGSGKSMFAERLPSIFPKLEKKEHLEVLRIQSSYSPRLSHASLSGRPPFRSPHHQCSVAAVIGRDDRPGELSLAHGGILFLDELPEFRRDILEALREPLENGMIRLSRALEKTTWLARIVLVAACNNCPCGWFGSGKRKCRCPTNKILAYTQRLSGPILDRIDMHVNVDDQSQERSTSRFRSKSHDGVGQTAAMAGAVVQAREFAARRNGEFGVVFNRDLRSAILPGALGVPKDVLDKMIGEIFPEHISQRAISRALRIARTLADLEQRGSMERRDLEQAWYWQAEASAAARGEHLFAG